MTNQSTLAPANACTTFLRDAGMPALPLPQDLTDAMSDDGAGNFSTANWNGGVPLREGAVRWLREGTSQRAAWCGVIPRGVHSTTVQIAFVSPRCSIFVNKLTSQAFADAAFNRRRVEGSFKLMRRLIDAVDKPIAWPKGKRLMLVDDDVDTLRWGWPQERGAHWKDLSSDSAAWVTALVSVLAMPASRSS